MERRSAISLKVGILVSKGRVSSAHVSYIMLTNLDGTTFYGDDSTSTSVASGAE